MTELSETLLPFDEPSSRQPVRELIGQSRRMMIRQTNLSPWFRSMDVNFSDYSWWDRARRGKVNGLELAGLFIKPLGSKVSSWVLGQRPNWVTSNDKANTMLNDWWGQWHASVLRAFNEALDLGDCYLVINGDLSVTVIPPHMVTPLVDRKDFSHPYGWKIVMQIPDPENAVEIQQIEDYFTPLYRRRIVRNSSGGSISDVTYPNPVGRLPIIHIANRKGTDEFYGRPEAESLVNAFIRYGDVLDAALKGNIRQGRPTPVIEEMGTMAQVDAFWAQFGKTETHTDPETGETTTVTIIEFDPDMLLTLGGTSKFRYAGPESFTKDTSTLLELIFYLIVQFSEIPEFVWGNAIGSSKASADSQLEPFLKWIIKRRGESMPWLQEITDLVLAYMGVYNQRFRSLQAKARWRPIASADGRLTLDAVIYLYSKGKLSDEDMLWLMPLGIDDPDTYIKNADKQNKELTTQGLAVGGGGAVPVPTPSVPGNLEKFVNPKPTPTATAPASGGGQTGNFNKQEAPLQPTERQQFLPDAPLYEQSIETILNHNRDLSVSEDEPMSLSGNKTDAEDPAA